MFDQSGRVFIHPSSVLFSESGFKSGYLAYFQKAETSKVFLRDATEVSQDNAICPAVKADSRYRFMGCSFSEGA